MRKTFINSCILFQRQENLKDASERLSMQFEQHKEVIIQAQNGLNSDIISISGDRG